METVAESVDDYIDIAVRLGLDDKWRESIRIKQEANLHKLYDDASCVSALEQFYLEVVDRKKSH